MNQSCNIKTIEDSPFFQKISAAIERYGTKAKGVWISITKDAEEYTPEGENKSDLIKWLSWSLVDNEHNELFEPYLLVVHSELSEKQIKKDLSSHFPNHEIVVDNEIYFK